MKQNADKARALDAGELATEEWHVVHDRLQREP